MQPHLQMNDTFSLIYHLGTMNVKPIKNTDFMIIYCNYSLILGTNYSHYS